MDKSSFQDNTNQPITKNGLLVTSGYIGSVLSIYNNYTYNLLDYIDTDRLLGGENDNGRDYVLTIYNDGEFPLLADISFSIIGTTIEIQPQPEPEPEPEPELSPEEKAAQAVSAVTVPTELRNPVPAEEARPSVPLGACALSPRTRRSLMRAHGRGSFSPIIALSRSATAGHGAVSHHPPARGGSSQRMQLVAARPWFTSGSNNQSSTPAAKVLAMARKAPPALVAPRQRRCDRALPWAAMRFLGAVFALRQLPPCISFRGTKRPTHCKPAQHDVLSGFAMGRFASFGHFGL